LLGDFERARKLTVHDIAAMMSALSDLNQFKTPRGLLASDLLAIGDFNHDGQVNNFDLQSLLSNLISGSAANIQGVPEPATLLHAIAAIVLFSCFRPQSFGNAPCDAP